MSSTFFKALRETRLPFARKAMLSERREPADAKVNSEVLRVLVIGGHPRQIQDISSIARSLKGGAEVESASSVASAQERLLSGTRIDWAVAAIRPFDPSYVSTLCKLHMRVADRSKAQWMALWPGLRPLDNELGAWDVHLNYPASVGQMRRALLGETIEP